MKISIVIPAYNEEERIINYLDEIINYFKKEKFEYEIIVVNDGSNDSTKEKAEKFLKEKGGEFKIISYPENRGKGYAVKRGVLESTGDLILFTDADGATPIKEFKRLFKFIEKNDIVIGTRAYGNPKTKAKASIYRKLIGKIFNLMVKIVVGLNFSDTQCGFKLFNRRAIDIFKDLKTERFAFDVEFLYKSKRRGFKIKEVPINWSEKGKSKINLIKDSLEMFFSVLKIKKYKI